MTKKSILLIGAVGALAASVGVAAAGRGILFPDWSQPSKGTYDAPAAELGEKPEGDTPWSQTTYTSSIMGKPIPGKAVSLVGEVIDISCYMQVGKHGDKHRECGQKCARNGQPVGLLAKDGTIYTLIDEEHDPRRDGLTNFRQFAVDNMANVVTVNGTLTEVEEQRAVFVQGYMKK